MGRREIQNNDSNIHCYFSYWNFANLQEWLTCGEVNQDMVGVRNLAEIPAVIKWLEQ